MPESYHSSYTQADILKAKLRASGEVQSIATTHSIAFCWNLLDPVEGWMLQEPLL